MDTDYNVVESQDKSATEDEWKQIDNELFKGFSPTKKNITNNPHFIRRKKRNLDNYRSLKTGAVPTEEEIYDRIKDIADRNLTLGSYLAFSYMIANRINEILRSKYLGKYRYDVSIREPPLKIKDIRIRETPNNEIEMFANVRTEKLCIGKVDKRLERKSNNSDKDKQDFLNHLRQVLKNKTRNVELPIFPGSVEEKLLHIIIQYLELNHQKRDDSGEYVYDRFGNPIWKNIETPIWNFSSKYVRKALKKYWDITPHILRHWRMKNLVLYRKFSPWDLQYFVGHSNVFTTSEYVSSNSWTIKQRFKESFKDRNIDY